MNTYFHSSNDEIEKKNNKFIKLRPLLGKYANSGVQQLNIYRNKKLN